MVNVLESLFQKVIMLVMYKKKSSKFLNILHMTNISSQSGNFIFSLSFLLYFYSNL